MKQEAVEIVRFQEASLNLDLKNQHVLFEKPDLLLALFVLENRNRNRPWWLYIHIFI
jgi:hypothetical protein